MNKTLQDLGKSETEGEQSPEGRARKKPLDWRGSKLCEAGVSMRRLQDFLFREKAGLALDEELNEHVNNSGCTACQVRKLQLHATEPFLYDEGEGPRVHVEPVPALRERPASENSERTRQLRAQVSRKLAALLATPAEPLHLAELSKFNASVRTVGDLEARLKIVSEVNRVCRARWQRLAPEGNSKVEAAAEELTTALAKYRTKDETKRERRLEDFGLKTTAEKRAFLLYMMSSPWFLHPQGEATWSEKPSGSPKGRRTVVLYMDVLSQARLPIPELVHV